MFYRELSHTPLTLTTSKLVLNPVIYSYVNTIFKRPVTFVEKNGFTFNADKSADIFSRQRGVHPLPRIVLQGQPVPVKNEHKVLRTLLDHKLTFIPHIKLLKMSRLKTMNIMKLLSHQSCGTDTKYLL